jgi:hypothetical protein
LICRRYLATGQERVLLTFLRTIILYGRLRSHRHSVGIMLVLPEGDVEDVLMRSLLSLEWPYISRVPVARMSAVTVCKLMLGRFAC